MVKSYEEDNPIPTPDELARQRKISLTPQVTALCKKWVEHLKKEFTGSNTVYINIEGTDYGIVDLAMEKFRSKGWSVRRENDKNKSHLTFCKPPEHSGNAWDR